MTGSEISGTGLVDNYRVIDNKIFEKWKEFFEGLTVEWLVENHVGTKIGTHPNDDILVYMCNDILIIVWDKITFYFDRPTRTSNVRLSPMGYTQLYKYLPVDVMKDFVRVVEL